MLSSFRCLLLASVFLALFPAVARAERAWTEVRSPHFRVITDGSTDDARKVANEFEQMRHVFAVQFGESMVDQGTPLTILAARDGDTFARLEPTEWKASHGAIAGEFLRRWEKQFAIVRLDTFGNQNEIVIYHEYTHSVLHAHAHWLPMWMDEGLAEFYGYTKFEPGRILIGGATVRLHALRTNQLIPVSKVLEANGSGPLFRDPEKADLFYAEAWTMVHYMIFGKGMGNGEKLASFFKALQGGTPQQKAFQDIFGDPAAFQKALSQYLANFSLTAAAFPADRSVIPKDFVERKLTLAETDLDLGCFEIAAYERAAGQVLIDKAVDLDPKLAQAHEELAYLDFDKGQDADAVKEWKTALELDPGRAHSLFALTMMGKPLIAQSPVEMRATRVALQQVAKLAPGFAANYIELALVEWRLGMMGPAYRDARTAEQLEPWRSGYHVFTGHILLHGGQPALAADFARYVAEHWFGSDHNEAVELFDAVPANSRGEAPPPLPDKPVGAQVTQGQISDTSCTVEPGGAYTLTLLPEGTPDAKPLIFKTDSRVQIGFSDTFWWGEDHFSHCHHLAGHRGVVAYTGDKLMRLEVRDDLPDSPAPAPKEEDLSKP